MMSTLARSSRGGLLAMGLWASRVAAQQPQDSSVAHARRIAAGATTLLARDAGRLWGVRLDTVPWFWVLGQRAFLSADPHADGFTASGDGLWSGPLPSDMIPSNTAVEWAGRRWAMATLPLAGDSLATTRLHIHEAWHVVQPRALPQSSYNEAEAGSELLDQPDGRIWLQLEWRALAEALESGGAKARTAARRALIFRARRYAAAIPTERDRERLLDLSEGMAEYTAWKLTGSDPRALAVRLREEAPQGKSYIRSFPYFTGPAYGLLLDRLAPRGWIARLRTTLDLQELLARALDGDRADVLLWLRQSGNRDALLREAERAGEPLGLAAVRAAETVRWEEQQRRLAELRGRYLEGPTLRIHPRGGVQVSFDPGRQVPLGDSGTVLGGFLWRAGGGAELSAPEGALVATDWREIRVPLDTVALVEGVLAESRTWTAGGWRLSLPAGWKLARAGASWEATPP